MRAESVLYKVERFYSTMSTGGSSTGLLWEDYVVVMVFMGHSLYPVLTWVTLFSLHFIPCYRLG